ncbi:stress responsive protein [Mycolicibacterium novocastrense]|uniref:Dabb family protein n=1 Tax=Mycolicibacterium novocastrense TaxID=59813 RepID=UPI00074AC281|nr:Dabb family protein [Mycolicibacterium novocastrense]KUH72014.1 stress responsive protein [Mycolicibacterium novocastrense]KUH72186.1 stress responsive protein [Mycolicibacterium novocastrense]KUH73137.1 stress responsive protein [Mycolicibacterium novocastrense]
MYSVIRLIDAAEAGRERLLKELRGAAVASGAAHALVQPTLPGVRNGGDILVHLRFRDADEWSSAATSFDAVFDRPEVNRVNGATYTGGPVATRDISATVYRTLLLRVQPDADDATVARFEDDLRLLPRYVGSIASWQLSRVDSAVGNSPWTHVFEQEFRDLDGLTGPYLMHPIHWAYVDRWFDPECPEVIVRDRVCHSFCDLPPQ